MSNARKVARNKHGEIIAWKVILGPTRRKYLVKLAIPPEAWVRYTDVLWQEKVAPAYEIEKAASWKARCSRARVLDIRPPGKGKKRLRATEKVGYSAHNSHFWYKVGDTVEPRGAAFDMTPGIDCASGIHFYFTREQAERHVL